MYLPLAISFAIAVLIAGPVTSFIGYYIPAMIFGSVLMAVATGLITTFAPDTPPVKWISYQILYGLGIGLAFQQPYTAVQTVLPEAQVPTALVVLSFAQQVGSIVALSIAQNVFVDRLSAKVAGQVPGLDVRTVVSGGALGIVQKVPPQFREQVLKSYNEVIVYVLYIALGLTCLTTIGALGIEWRSVKEEKEE